MRTEDLIRQLAGDTTTRPRATLWQTLVTPSLITLLCAVVLTVAVYGIRADLASVQAAVISKQAVFAILVAAILPLVQQLIRPNTSVRHQLPLPVAPFVLSALAAALFIHEQPADLRMVSWIGHGIPGCLYLIPPVALPGTLVLMWFVRLRQAPTRLAFAGAALGAFAGSIAGLAYALHCTSDEPAYVLSWYPLAILISAAIGAIAGRWMLRW